MTVEIEREATLVEDAGEYRKDTDPIPIDLTHEGISEYVKGSRLNV